MDPEREFQHRNVAASDEAPGEDGITLVGLVLESAAGLRRALSPGLEDQLGVGGQSFELLVRLARTAGNRLRMSDLAAQAGLSPSGLSRAVDRLVEANLVVRESCPGDRRGTNARLTELGAQRMHEALSRHRDDVDALLDGLYSPPERAALAQLLRRLRDRVHPEAALVSALEDAPR
jgi:DNA-binding MarR family transcriptional regulator